MILFVRIFSIMSILLSGLVWMALPIPSYAATQEIAAVVNEDMISMQDLNKRMKLIIVSSGLENKREIREKLLPQVLGSLIDEKIMQQEGRKINVTIDQREIDNGFAKISGQNKFKPAKFKSVLRKSGIDVTTMYDQISAQIVWGHVVQGRLRSKVVVSDRDVDDALERIRSKIGTTEYLAAEIFLPVDDPKQEKKVKQLANRLVSQIKGGKASFFKLAQQFSGAAGANNGGDTGWLHEAQIDEKIGAGLKGVKKNKITDPIRSLNGYHIMFLRDTRILSEETVPSRDQVYFDLGTKRLEKMQRRYLNDLKASSFIDIRV